mmetsp:Transcript_14438/g.31302  ORF Transcript_14438/g.31302 Transcript_14438/m.31302 type:complete len:533 (-) Transcript_14438:1572-3170(-)
MRASQTLSIISKRIQNQVQRKIITSSCHSAATLPPIGSRFLDRHSKYGMKSSIEFRKCHQLSQTRTYGSRTVVELEEEPLHGMEPIQPYIRSSLATHGEDSEKAMDMEFVVSFLGTGGGAPTRHRIGSCTALRLGGQTFLFDAGEGTQRQLEFSRIITTSITKIFVSHLHGDHLYGLVPTILGIMVAHKLSMNDPRKKMRRGGKEPGEKATLEIYGPPGLFNYINMVLTLSCAKVNYLNINVIELVGGREERGPMSSRPRQRGRRNIFLSHYPEIETPLITRKYLEQNEDNVWVIDAPEQISHKSLEKGARNVSNGDGFHRLPNDVNLGAGRRLHIKAAQLDHLAGVQTFGYTVEEQQPPGTIDMEKTKALGIRPGKKYGLLKCGLSVPTDDGLGEVHPDQVLIKSFRPRKVAILADHRLIPRQMALLCKGADLVVHESTLSKSDGIDKIKMRGHNNAFNGGMFGKDLGCKVVALNHFGKVSTAKDYVGAMVDEAREGNQNASQIIASYDFMEVFIPRGGFDFSDNDIEKDK